jgi:hypothetical protein
VLLDVDNDGDLDMALTDEIDDTVTILQNTNGPSPLCPPTPAMCRGSARSGKSSLLLKDKSPDTGDRLVWKWVAGLATPKADYGDPLGSDDFAICLYDAGTLLASVTADHGGLCAGKPCWADKPTSFVYTNRDLSPTGAQKLQLVEGLADGKAKIVLKAKGTPLAMPNLGALVGPLDVQLHRSGGSPCFGSTFSAPFLKNAGGTFKDRAD